MAPTIGTLIVILTVMNIPTNQTSEISAVTQATEQDTTSQQAERIIRSVSFADLEEIFKLKGWSIAEKEYLSETQYHYRFTKEGVSPDLEFDIVLLGEGGTIIFFNEIYISNWTVEQKLGKVNLWNFQYSFVSAAVNSNSPNPIVMKFTVSIHHGVTYEFIEDRVRFIAYVYYEFLNFLQGE